MEERRELFDASAYMMFEATGDSEAHEYFDAPFEEESDASVAAAAPEEDEEDDAQSCSYVSSYRNAAQVHEAVGGGGDHRGPDFESFSEDEEDYSGGSDEEDGVVDQCRNRRRKAEAMKSKGCEESNAMMMNEREGDKLFWEACLAS